MSYKLEPAFSVYQGLTRKIINAGMNPENQWFFSDGGFSPDGIVEKQPNTMYSEDFVVMDDECIIAYFTGRWVRSLTIITGFRMIIFEKKKAHIAGKAFFEYLDYLFTSRGCKAFNWIVAVKNINAYKVYEKFISRYLGHKVGMRYCGQKSYCGEISDIALYEITDEEYRAWKSQR